VNFNKVKHPKQTLKLVQAREERTDMITILTGWA